MKIKKKPFDVIFFLLSIISGLVVMVLLISMIIYMLVKGLPNISWEFLSTTPSELYNRVGILPFIINTIYYIIISLLISVPLGVFAAIYLNEYAKKSKILNLIELTIQVLAGIPSIVYGLFGMVFFGFFLGLGESIINGALTLSIMILPTIITTTKQALSEVNPGYKQASIGLGATKLYTMTRVLLPAALPGIVNGIILSIGRVVSESAALIYTGGLGTNISSSVLGHISDSGASLTVQLYLYAMRGEDLGITYAIASILVLVIIIINIFTKRFSKVLIRKNSRRSK